MKNIKIKARMRRHLYEMILTRFNKDVSSLMTYITKHFDRIKQEEDPVFIKGFMYPRLMKVFIIALNYLKRKQSFIHTQTSGERVLVEVETSLPVFEDKHDFKLDSYMSYLKDLKNEFDDDWKEFVEFRVEDFYIKHNFLNFSFTKGSCLYTKRFLRTESDILDHLMMNVISFEISDESDLKVFETYFFESKIPEQDVSHCVNLLVLKSGLSVESFLSTEKVKVRQKPKPKTVKHEPKQENKDDSDSRKL